MLVVTVACDSPLPIRRIEQPVAWSSVPKKAGSPSTCAPEGYTAEDAKGNVRQLDAGGTASFDFRLAHLDIAETTT
ncbi:hypothetical protein ONR75_16385 [Rhodopseudomonas sp. P2A-2r]|uniref:hypothetical protein n=1 Tax=Rhodopseudomonas sp. P2A-2r TaxID=2991972 RepID=UPI002234105F|nr:hypothetical protein [Rhodopseudomonas sp. P2A-2r]UZE46659.1 hypothetical protein ONR75_16385 [Rhodopseudomonas sp. P2A-2r]